MDKNSSSDDDEEVRKNTDPKKKLLKKIKIENYDKPTLIKVIQKCRQQRSTPVPIKGIDFRQATLKAHESLVNICSEDPTGFTLSWDCLRPMLFTISKLYHNTDILKPKTILDVGCGLGILGIFLRKLFLRAMIKIDLIDQEPNLLQLAKFNINLNGLGDRIQLQKIDCQEIKHQKDLLSDNYSLIMFNDMIDCSKKGIVCALSLCEMLEKTGVAILSHKFIHAIKVSEVSEIRQEHEPFDSGLENFLQYMTSAGYQYQDVFQPEPGDVIVQLIGKSKHVIDMQQKQFNDRLKEGITYESVMSAEPEEIQVLLRERKFNEDLVDQIENKLNK